jgi:nicotinamide-nucleotide amidase
MTHRDGREGDDLEALARRVGEALAAAGETLATAESCTGGWIAKALTDVAGSSAWFGWGVVTYSNEAKQALLGVPAAVLDAHGAVSQPVVEAMVRGALARSGAARAVAVSGVAGPDGGSPGKPVGTVWIAWARRGAEGYRVRCAVQRFAGDRAAVRRQSVRAALEGVIAP